VKIQEEAKENTPEHGGARRATAPDVGKRKLGNGNVRARPDVNADIAVGGMSEDGSRDSERLKKGAIRTSVQLEAADLPFP